MKRIPSVIIIIVCLLLTACCSGTFTEASDDNYYWAPSPVPSTTADNKNDMVYKQKLTLTFDFGVRTGSYAGDMMDGLPHGHGVFESQNPKGIGWIYSGEWNKGHMQGKGIVWFQGGYQLTGWYENDYLKGKGSLYQYEMLLFEGELVKGIPNGWGTAYSCCGEIIFSGIFTEGYIDETENARLQRLSLFKESCTIPDYDTMLETAQKGGDMHAKASGTVREVESGGLATTCNFIMEIQDGNMVGICYILSMGELPMVPGQKVDVWGIPDCLCSYNDAWIPEIEAWDVQNISAAQ